MSASVVRTARHAGASDRLTIAASARGLDPLDLPLSVRAEKALKKLGVRRLADLDGLAASRLTTLGNCGKKTVHEIRTLLLRARAGEFEFKPSALRKMSSLALFAQLDETLRHSPQRDRELVVLRLGGGGRPPAGLQTIAAQYNISHQRVSQIIRKTLDQCVRCGGPKSKALLQALAVWCHHHVCPLTPGLLRKWGPKPWPLRYQPQFYVRVMAELRPGIPAWPEGQKRVERDEERLESIARALESYLKKAGKASLRTAFEAIRAVSGLRKTTPEDFLLALKQSRRLMVRFPEPDRPEVRLRFLHVLRVARAVLQASATPLTPESILALARARYGSDAIHWKPRPTGDCLTPDQGFYLLGPRLFGLRRHFLLPAKERRLMKRNCFGLLKSERRPISTPEIINNQAFPWAAKASAYELAEVLREDPRFRDLGKFLFVLAEWGIEQRAHIKDLIPQVLAEIGRPATAAEVHQQLQRLRSVSRSGIAHQLRTTPCVQDCGSGRFGLKSWGENPVSAKPARAWPQPESATEEEPTAGEEENITKVIKPWIEAPPQSNSASRRLAD
jgi:hypothetical protein